MARQPKKAETPPQPKDGDFPAPYPTQAQLNAINCGEQIDPPAGTGDQE